MKERHRALPADLLQDANHFIPPAVFSRAARLTFRLATSRPGRPTWNLVISNVPGPQFPLYCAGRQARGELPGVGDHRRHGAEHHGDELPAATSTSGSSPTASRCPTSRTSWAGCDAELRRAAAARRVRSRPAVRGAQPRAERRAAGRRAPPARQAPDPGGLSGARPASGARCGSPSTQVAEHRPACGRTTVVSPRSPPGATSCAAASSPPRLARRSPPPPSPPARALAQSRRAHHRPERRAQGRLRLRRLPTRPRTSPSPRWSSAPRTSSRAASTA